MEQLGTASRCSAALLPSVIVTTTRASAAGVTGRFTSSIVLIVPAYSGHLLDAASVSRQLAGSPAQRGVALDAGGHDGRHLDVLVALADDAPRSSCSPPCPSRPSRPAAGRSRRTRVVVRLDARSR